MSIFDFHQWRHTHIQMVGYIEKQSILSSDSDIDSTIISNSEGYQYVEID